MRKCLLGLLFLSVVLLAACEGEKTPESGGEKAVAKKGGGDFVPGGLDKGAGDAAAKAEFKGVGLLFPRPEELKKYSLSQGPDYYTKDTLFEIIDGASAAYLEYGVTDMVKTVYKAKEGDYKDEINVEIYKFVKAESAFGKFGRERGECGEKKGLGDNWCVRQSDLIFWKGKHLVKVQAFDDSKAAEAATMEVASKVAAKIKEGAELPGVFAKFPTELRVAGSGGYSTIDPYGLGGLKNLYTMGYRPEGDAYKNPDDFISLYLSEFPNEDAAKTQFEAMKKLLDAQSVVKAKGGVKALDGVEGAFVYTDKYKTHTFFLKAKVVAGGRDFSDEGTAKKMTSLFKGAL
jgi:hypothetical protein